MYSYLLLNIIFMSLVAVAAVWFPWKKIRCQNLLIVLLILLVMTAVFDSLIIALGLVTYDVSKILGIYIGRAPIEDFSYAIIAAFLVPLLWERGAKK